MKNLFRLKPPDIRLLLAVAFCAVFFIGQDANEDKICATHKYGNLVIQNKASDKKLEVNLKAVSYEEPKFRAPDMGCGLAENRLTFS